MKNVLHEPTDAVSYVYILSENPAAVVQFLGLSSRHGVCVLSFLHASSVRVRVNVITGFSNRDVVGRTGGGQ